MISKDSNKLSSSKELVQAPQAYNDLPKLTMNRKSRQEGCKQRTCKAVFTCLMENTHIRDVPETNVLKW